MILIPSMAKTAASDLAHLAYIVNPTFLDDVDDLDNGAFVKNTRITGSVLVPPEPVLSCAMAAEWTLNASVNLGAASVSATNQALIYSSEPTLGEKTFGAASREIIWSGSSLSGTDNLFVSFGIGRLPPNYGRIAGEWSLPFGILITATTSGGTGDFSGGYQVSLGAFGPSYGGISVTVAGQAVAVYDTVAGAASPTGTITLTPSAWLGFT